MFSLISSLWFIRTTKAILFWLYLWQLKEYHWGRFIDHFRTAKGKSLFLNWLFIFKFFLLFYSFSLALYPHLLKWQLYAFWIIILGILYFLEIVKTGLDFIQKKLKKPVLTKKTAILILLALGCQILFLFVLFQKIKIFYWFVFGLLAFDLLTPFITSGIVLSIEPFAIFLRNQIIQKAKRKRESFKNLLVIGITGSYGKTSTKEFLATILAEKFGKNKVLKTKEHQNSEMGISQCILDNLKPEHEIFVVEMGAYNKGGIKLLTDIVNPKIGIISGVNEQHLATFGSMKSLLSAEGGEELIEALPNDGLIIFNGNNKYCQEIYQKTKIRKKICYTTFPAIAENVVSRDLWAEEIKVEKDFITFKVFSKDGDFANFKVNLIGAQNVENILLAACCAKELGMNLEEISNASRKLKPLPHQMELKRGINGLNVIDSTYSANPDGVFSHLEYLRIFSGKKVIVMPCLIELGKASKEIHKKIGQKISKVCDLAIITTKDRLKEIKEGAREKMAVSENILFIENSKEIFEKIKSFCQAGDVVLLEGRVPEKLIKQLLLSNSDHT